MDCWEYNDDCRPGGYSGAVGSRAECRRQLALVPAYMATTAGASPLTFGPQLRASALLRLRFVGRLRAGRKSVGGIGLFHPGRNLACCPYKRKPANV